MNMKKAYLLILLVLALGPVVQAQTIANNSFENWTYSLLYEIDTVDNWFCGITEPGLFYGATNQPYARSTNAQDGNYSLLIRRGDYGSYPVHRSITPGFSQNSLRGYYQCNVVAGDSARIMVAYSKADVVQRQASIYLKGTVSEWTLFQVRLVKDASADSVEIRFYNSSNQTDTSKLWIDNIQFDQFVGEQGIVEIEGPSIYPNPASDQLNVKYSDNNIPEQIRIIDFNGRVVRNFSVNGKTNYSLNISGLSSGSYLLESVGEGFHLMDEIRIN